MKNYAHYFLFFAMLFVLHGRAAEINTNDWGPITNNLQMSIGLKGGEMQIKTNQPCRLIIRIRNGSTNKPVSFIEAYEANTDLVMGVSCIVTTLSGKDISPNTEKAFLAGSGAFITVPPNQTKEFEFDLSRLCKFDEVGTYKIIAKKMMMSDEHEEVVSNPFYFSVVAGEWKDTNSFGGFGSKSK